MPDCKLYRRIAVADLPDTDWVAAQAIPAASDPATFDDVRNIYSLWPGRAAIELVPVWWNEDTAPAGVGVAVHNTNDVTLQPVEIKLVAAPNTDPDVNPNTPAPMLTVVVNATSAQTEPGFEKQSLLDTSADAMYIRVTAPGPMDVPAGATHLYLLAEVTP